MVDENYLPQDPGGRLLHVVEEIAEVQIELSRLTYLIGKVGRFGWAGIDPRVPEHLRKNNARLFAEVFGSSLQREWKDLNNAVNAVAQDVIDATQTETSDVSKSAEAATAWAGNAGTVATAPVAAKIKPKAVTRHAPEKKPKKLRQKVTRKPTRR